MMVFYINLTYKRETMTILAIAIMAAAMVSASVVIALTVITEGIGMSHAYACKKGDPGPCGVKVPRKRIAELV